MEKTAPKPAPRLRWWLALASLLLGVLFTAGCSYRFGTKPEPKECQLHHVMMTRTRVPVLYAYIDYTKDYMEACPKEFPNATTCVFKGSRHLHYLLGRIIDRHDRVWVCPKCLEAKKNWKPKKS